MVHIAMMMVGLPPAFSSICHVITTSDRSDARKTEIEKAEQRNAIPIPLTSSLTENKSSLQHCIELTAHCYYERGSLHPNKMRMRCSCCCCTILMGAVLTLGVLVSRISAFAASDTNSNHNNNPTSTQKTKYMLTSSDPIILKQQADALRAEADALRIQLDRSKEEAEQRRLARVDNLIESMLVNFTINDDNQLLNTEEQVARLIQDERLSVENINNMFDRIVEQSQRRQSIDNCSPLISLLLDAACKVDCMEREDNPNKRWNHRVERDLRKKLFALGWGIDLDQVKKEKEGIRSIHVEKDLY